MGRPDVRIENPCHVKWNDLVQLENSKNRHCLECSFDIIDFTNMTNEEIINYLADRHGKKVCGALRPSERKSGLNTIQRTVKTWNTRIKSSVRNNYFKTFLLFSIGIVLFATGCKNDDDDEVVIGLIELPDETQLTTETVTKTNDSTLVKVLKP